MVWKKYYKGFEDIYDLERDIQWAIEHEGVVPDGHWQGTLKVTMEYIEVEGEVAMNYTTYELHGRTTVTINDDQPIELYRASTHLVHVGTNSGDFGKRYIFSDKGNRSRFEAFEKAVANCLSCIWTPAKSRAERMKG
jgi:hypothetical protein